MGTERWRRDALSVGDDFADAFVATDLTFDRGGNELPGVCAEGVVSVADTRIEHANQNLSRTRCLNRKLDDFVVGSTRFGVDDGLVDLAFEMIHGF